MSPSRLLFANFLLVFLGSAANAEPLHPQLGTPASADELARLSINVFPDGSGLPAGSSTAEEGTTVYQTHCLACHGQEGRGGLNDELSGGAGTLVSTKPKRTVGSYWPYATSLFDYIRRAMPYNAPGSLSNNELYAVTAYLLYINRIIEFDQTMDATTLPAVVMPNHDGFVWPEVPPESQPFTRIRTND